MSAINIIGVVIQGFLVDNCIEKFRVIHKIGLEMTANSKMDFDLLKTFIAVVDNGSFTRAAGQVHRTQSAISMQIKRLEAQLDKSLFVRKGRDLQLTIDGKALVSYTRRILALHDEALNSLKNHDNVKNLRLGCPDDYAPILIPHLIDILRQHLPKVKLTHITANSGELRQLMDNGELDLAILTRLPNSNEGVMIYQEQGVWVCKDESQLQQQPIPLALAEASCKFHSMVIDGLEKQDIAYDLLCETSNSRLLIELVRKGEAVTVLASKAVPEDLIVLRDYGDLPTLPVAEVIISLKGADQGIEGLPLQDIASRLVELSINHSRKTSIKS
jgi:DNA-binding transcriptional LysR family regulator